MWRWADGIEENSTPSPFIAIWPRNRGKSTHAESLAAEVGRHILYVATAEAKDEEMRTRIQKACRKIEENAEDGPVTQLHRWIGFIQGAMMAHRMLDLDGAKAMFDQAKIAHGETSDDLLDHLDPNSSFKVDIGGEG